jgi:hypothetical protein
MREQPLDGLPNGLSAPADSPDYWTSILRRAGPIARSQVAVRPCSYTPWQWAFGTLGVERTMLSTFAENASRSIWPAESAALVEFALTFLEEDPMLFRSGYTKRNFAKRLGQQAMIPSQIARLQTVLRRAVIRGAGLEEFHAYCKLAARLQPDGLQDWLANTSADVRLSLPHVGDGVDIMQVRCQLSKHQLGQAFSYAEWPRKPAYALGHDLQPPLYPMTNADWGDPANKTRVNAWRMLRAIRRRNNQGSAVLIITAPLPCEAP